MDVLLIAGMSGAGRGTAAKLLEELGWYVIDGLPPSLIGKVVELMLTDESQVRTLCVAADLRSRTFNGDLGELRRQFLGMKIELRVLFLDASDETLIRRFEKVRRRHPLQGGGTLADGIAAERYILQQLKSEADLLVDTSGGSVARLRDRLRGAFGTLRSGTVTVTVESFGFKSGILLDADMVLDVRFLPNPFWVAELRPLTGLAPEVSDYVLAQSGASEFVDRYAKLLDPVLDGYRREGKSYLTVGVGCTGGRHRSVAVTEELVRRLRSGPLCIEARAAHRDLRLE